MLVISALSAPAATIIRSNSCRPIRSFACAVFGTRQHFIAARRHAASRSAVYVAGACRHSSAGKWTIVTRPRNLRARFRPPRDVTRAQQGDIPFLGVGNFLGGQDICSIENLLSECFWGPRNSFWWSAESRGGPETRSTGAQPCRQRAAPPPNSREL